MKKYHGTSLCYHGTSLCYHGASMVQKTCTMVHYGIPWVLPWFTSFKIPWYTMVQFTMAQIHHGTIAPWYNVDHKGILDINNQPRCLIGYISDLLIC